MIINYFDRSSFRQIDEHIVSKMQEIAFIGAILEKEKLV